MNYLIKMESYRQVERGQNTHLQFSPVCQGFSCVGPGADRLGQHLESVAFEAKPVFRDFFWYHLGEKAILHSPHPFPSPCQAAVEWHSHIVRLSPGSLWSKLWNPAFLVLTLLIGTLD